MGAALDFDHLPASTLDLLLSMLTADPGAGSARRWADDMLTAGVSSDALIELALLQDHEWNRAAALLPQALCDAGIETEPRGSLPILFYRMILRAYLDGRMRLSDFGILLEMCLLSKGGTEGVAAAENEALEKLLLTIDLFRASGSGGDGDPILAEEEEVTAAARAAFARLSA